MAQIAKQLTVDVAKENLFPPIIAKQNDTNSRFLQVTLVNEKQPITIAADSTVVINALREDGQANGFSGTLQDDGTILVPITQWMLELDGKVECDISVLDTDGRRLTSTGFAINVEPSAYSRDDITSDPEYDILAELIVEATASAEKVADIVNRREVNGVLQVYIANKGNTTNRNTIISDENGNVQIEPLDEYKGVDTDTLGNIIKNEVRGVNHFIKGRGNSVIMLADNLGGAFVMGNKHIVTGSMSNTVGYENTNRADGGAFVCGNNNTVEGFAATAEGQYTSALNTCSHTEGIKTTASGAQAHIEGYSETRAPKFSPSTTYDEILDFWNREKFSLAMGSASHVEGKNNLAIGNYSHASGYFTHAVGTQAHTEGAHTVASGNSAHAQGNATIASGAYSHAGGYRTIASGRSQSAIGEFNKENPNALFIVGNGTSETNRKNAFQVNKNGTATVEADPVNNMDVATKKYVDNIFAKLQQAIISLGGNV